MRTCFLVLVLVLGLIPAASASDGPARGAFGVVTAVSADSITVQPEHDVALSCRVPADKRDAFAALHVAVGQRLAILCVQDGDRYVLAKISVSAPTPQARERAVEGVVTALSGESITVKPSSGDALTCAVRAVRPDGIAVGNRVGMACSFDGARYVLVKVRRLPDKPQPPLTRRVKGTLAALSSESLTVKQDNGEAVTCAIPAAARARVTELHLAVGDRVAAACKRDGGRWVLVQLKRA
jgi:hypothetical protein